AIGSAVQQSISIGDLWINQRMAQVHSGSKVQSRSKVQSPKSKVGGGTKLGRNSRNRMVDDQFLRVQEHALGRRATVEGVAQDRKTMLSRMHPDLMSAASHRLGFYQGHPVFKRADAKARLGLCGSGMKRSADILFTAAHQSGNGGKFGSTNWSVRKQQVLLAN